MKNLRNYINVSPTQIEGINCDSFILNPFGQGAGTFGLPGDYTPPSRFVRAAFQKTHTDYSNNQAEAGVAVFILWKVLVFLKVSSLQIAKQMTILNILHLWI